MRRIDRWLALRCACVALIACHVALSTWVLRGDARARSAEPSADAAAEVEIASFRSRLDVLHERTGALASSAARLGPPASNGRRTPVASAALEPSGEARRWSDVLDRTAQLEADLTERAWQRFGAWSGAHAGVRGPWQPGPLDPLDLGRFARLACLTELARRHPDGWAYPAALSALRAELRSNPRRLPLRLLALKMLRRLGPRELDGERVVFVSLAGNETAHGDVLVPDDSVAGLVQVGRSHPELRAELHQALWGVRHSLLTADLLDALRDARLAVREGAILALAEHPADAQRDAALRSAREHEGDARLRKLIDEALAGSR